MRINLSVCYPKHLGGHEWACRMIQYHLATNAERCFKLRELAKEIWGIDLRCGTGNYQFLRARIEEGWERDMFHVGNWYSGRDGLRIRYTKPNKKPPAGGHNQRAAVV